ncbi:MAG: hypothetical protein CM15mP106_5280 [Candidatus Neomarinimicrobiota bacterium]|nr:MAG: hypothetical protein CM15mP106_5280 [Candidatus Neomarinimicrobiota bacterium]
MKSLGYFQNQNFKGENLVCRISKSDATNDFAIIVNIG